MEAARTTHTPFNPETVSSGDESDEYSNPFNVNMDIPMRSFRRSRSPENEDRSEQQQPPKRTRIEDVVDEDEPEVWEEIHPEELRAGKPIPGMQRVQTRYERMRQEQLAAGLPPWSRFTSEEDWELAQWLIRSGTSQSKINEFLKLRMARTVFILQYIST